MMDWVDIRLGDACSKIGSGATPRGGGSVYLDAGPISFIRSQNVYNDGFSKDGLVYLDEKLAQGLANVQVEELDVLLNITGDSVARACQVIKDVLPARVNQHVAIIRANQEILWPTYLRYFLVSPAMQARMLGLAAVGATRNALTKGMIESFSIRCPKKVGDQKAIADILCSLDRRVDLNRRINQTLEAMAQAIFKSWFVDFDPVKAKIAAIQGGRDPLRAAMSAISGKSDAELDALPPEQYEQLATTAALFPDEMEASKLGEIPRGWVFKSVADIAQFASGKVDVSSLNEGIYISTENMLENRAGVTCATSLPSVVTVPSFKASQILVSNIRPYFKKIWMARFDGGRSPDVLAFESSDSQCAEFLYNLMYQDTFFEFMTRTAKGAKMPRGDKDAIMGWKFPCPDGHLMAAFSEKVRPHYAGVESLTSQNKSLTELRDTLLPKLISGELPVAEINGEVEA
jgi:type I restriction enzyme S subunit